MLMRIMTMMLLMMMMMMVTICFGADDFGHDDKNDAGAGL